MNTPGDSGPPAQNQPLIPKTFVKNCIFLHVHTLAIAVTFRRTGSMTVPNFPAQSLFGATPGGTVGPGVNFLAQLFGHCFFSVTVYRLDQLTSLQTIFQCVDVMHCVTIQEANCAITFQHVNAAECFTIQEAICTTLCNPSLYTRRFKKRPNFCYKDFILQHFKHCPLQSNPFYWRYTIFNVSSIVEMLPGTHFLWWRAVLLSHFPESPRVKKNRTF